ncbi:DNA mismatch repair endonuclease MutL [Halocola ammonii]
MPDIIQLLPDAVANQIAAGEVIQRPASVVKELLENAIDAGSTSVKLIVKDAGKTLIQVVDNGCGMSDTDARMSFERHATSKINSAHDLFKIHTKGFRGEALASIAAIAHVEMKTRLSEEQMGTKILVEGTEVKAQEPCATATGTSIAVKNLFFNVPARRNFLKSDGVEMRHIIDEFQRVALTHSDVAFQLHHNKSEVFNLPTGSLRQRIVGVFGNKYNQRLVPVQESTDIVSVQGFVGKPEFAKKTRGEQFFFVNKRFIKNNYLNHAVASAYRELMPKDAHPLYFLYMEIDPTEIDVNIHPTKTEIKFQDERAIYAIIHSAVRNSLGKFNISPSLDFEQETSIQIDPISSNRAIKQPSVEINPGYNPFDNEKRSGGGSGFGGGASGFEREKRQDWKELYRIIDQPEQDENHGEINEFTRETVGQSEDAFSETESAGEKKPAFQLHKKYIVTQIKSGMVVIDQQRAHERVLYEQTLQRLENRKSASQQLLFQQTVHLSASDYELMKELVKPLEALGFEVGDFGNNAMVVSAVPAEAAHINAPELMEQFIEKYKHNSSEMKLELHEKLASSLAYSMCIKQGKSLSTEEMHHLIDQLFACRQPYYAISGKPTITTFTLADIDQKFE